MGAEQNPLDVPGEDPEEGRDRPGWLHPDDRLWRHPSEVRAHPSPSPPPRPVPLLAWFKGHPARTLVPVSLLSGLFGALACTGLLYSTGAIGHTEVNVVTRKADPPSSAVANGQVASPASIPGSVEPWVVTVTVNGAAGESDGSGVVVEAVGDQCYVVTDNSIIIDAGAGAQATVTTYQGTTKAATVALSDPSAGITVLEVNWFCSTTAPLTSVAEVQTGEPVYAVGSSGLSATSGGSYYAQGAIVDQDNYVAPVNSGSAAMFSMLIAEVNVDSTAMGGALVDGNGNLIGITNPVPPQLQKTGITYVTPIDIVMADISSLAKYGKLSPHAWLGIMEAGDIDGPGATAMGIEGAVQVDTVAPGSPLARAGLVNGDVVTAVNGSPMPSVGILIEQLADADVGAVWQVNWVHNDRRRSADVTLTAQPAAVGPS